MAVIQFGRKNNKMIIFMKDQAANESDWWASEITLVIESVSVVLYTQIICNREPIRTDHPFKYIGTPLNKELFQSGKRASFCFIP